TALDCAKKAEKEAADNKREMANALLTHANLLAAMSSKPKDKKLVEAVSDTRQALTLEPDETIAHFNLGVLLMKQEQDADGVTEMKAYLASNNTDPATVKSAREDIADPRRAREPYAPEFSFNTLEHQQISLASLHGKVALLDFWGSWCPPCRASIPTIAALQKDFAKKNKDVEFVGISSDDDSNAWQKFIAANRMVWPEYLDLDGHVQHAFAVDSYPTYIVLDRNGVIRFRQSGFDEQSSGGELAEALDKALKVKLETGALAAASGSADSAAAPAQAPASTSNTAAQPTSVYGNPEPTYIKGPSYNAAASSNATPSSASGKGSFIVEVLVQPNAGDGARSYVASIAQTVKSRWLVALPQEAQEGKAGVVLVQLEIGHDGKLADDAEIMKSSGSDALDHSALAAVSAAAPFATPPASSDSTFEMQIIFAYNESLTDAVHSLASDDPQ
ncbi:MAG TPA: TonB family protein, partial [Candidatus Acidoferrales bacterium]|nr:TonB family protein [Candidatus Acidoferrales bacterium]